jgi:membrane protease subunit HflK
MTNGYGKTPEFNFDKINFDLIKKYIIPIAIVIGVIILGYSSIFTVKANQEATILRFGKYMETVGPGLQFKLPFGIDRN